MVQGNAHHLTYIVIKCIICNTCVSFQTGFKLKPSTNDRDRTVCVTPLPKCCGCISVALRPGTVLTLISSVLGAKDKIRQLDKRFIQHDVYTSSHIILP